MGFKLADYQSDAVGRVMESISRGNSEILFSAPTGSGKTVMMAELIKKFHFRASARGLKSACVWLSFSPDLVRQSRLKVEKHIFSEGGSGFKTRSDSDLQVPGITVAPFETWFLNWEKFSGKDSGTAKRLRGLGTESYATLDSAFADSGTMEKLVIIDEAHRNDTGFSDNVLSAIGERNVFVVRVTATMTERLAKKADDVITVRPEVVSESGLLRRRLYLNLGIGKTQDFLSGAWNARKKLVEEYESCGVRNANPLVIVQVPNASKSTEHLPSVRKISEFKEKFGDDVVARSWMEGKGEAFPGIPPLSDDERLKLESPESPVNLLVFKVKASTGWDCPRAQILVKFRERSESETFDAQVLGRIMRTYRGRFYENDSVDSAYLFGDYSSGEIRESIELDPSSPSVNVSERRDFKVLAFQLPEGALRLENENYAFDPSSKVQRTAVSTDSEIVMKTFETVFSEFRERLSEDFEAFRFSTEERGLRSGDVMRETVSGTIESPLSGKWGRSDVRDESVVAHDSDIEAFVLKSAKSVMNVPRECLGFETFSQTSVRMLAEKAGTRCDREWFAFLYGAFSSGNSSVSEFFRLLGEGIRGKDSERRKVVERYVYDGKAERTPPFKTSPWAYRGGATGRQDGDERFVNLHPDYEIPFAKALSESENVEWWIKNGDSGRDAFGITYEDAGVPRRFHPDFIVKFSDGRIGVLETKGVSTATETRFSPEEKFSALSRRIKEFLATDPETPIFGGFLTMDSGKWKILRHHSGFSSDFSEWEDFSKELFGNRNVSERRSG